MLARMWSNRNAHSSLLECRMVQLLGKTVVVSYQAKYYCHHMIQQSHDLVFTQRSYKHVHMELYKDVHGNCVPNCQNLEATKISFKVNR